MDKQDTGEWMAPLCLDKVTSIPLMLLPHRKDSYLLGLAVKAAVLVPLYPIPWRPQEPGTTAWVKEYGLVSVIMVDPFQISGQFEG